MKRLSGGNLRAAGYDDRNRLLVVELSAGTFQYSGVTPETWRPLRRRLVALEFLRDNIRRNTPPSASARRGSKATTVTGR